MSNKAEVSNTYRITAKFKKSTYEEEHWFNTVNGKRVELHITTCYRWGSCAINLTDTQKNLILKKDSILLNEYDYEFEEMWDGDSKSIEIQNEDNYSNEEIKEIYKTMYNDEDEDLDEDFMESNGWILDETFHGLSSPCDLELIT